MAVGNDVAAVGEQNTTANIRETLLLEVLELLEECGNVDDGTGANEIGASWVHQTGGQQV